MRYFIALIVLFLFANPCFAIKIGLMDSVKKAPVATSKKGYITNAKTGKVYLSIPAQKAYYLRADGKRKISIYIKGEKQSFNTDKVRIVSAGNGYVFTKNKWYRGSILVTNNNGKLNVINQLMLEEYLMGVVPSEMPPLWNVEAHKAQAIAARSYAIANLGKYASRGYDLSDTTKDQAYGGLSKETSQTNYAVKKTKGQVLVYNRQIIPAYYHSSAGGRTKKASAVWSKDLPYIKPVYSYDKKVRKNGHGVGMSQHGANTLAKKGYNAYQILNYFYKNIDFARVNKTI